MPSESSQKWKATCHTCSEPVRKVSAWDPFLVKVRMSFYSVNTFSKLFTFMEPAESPLLWLHSVGVETLWGSAGFRRNLLRFVSVIWTESTTLFRERQILQEHVYKQYSGTVILYVMFLFSEDFSCQRRNSKQTLDSFSVTAGISAWNPRHVTLFCCLPRLVGI